MKIYNQYCLYHVPWKLLIFYKTEDPVLCAFAFFTATFMLDIQYYTSEKRINDHVWFKSSE